MKYTVDQIVQLRRLTARLLDRIDPRYRIEDRTNQIDGYVAHFIQNGTLPEDITEYLDTSAVSDAG
jgi:hypothetical protein